MASDPISGFGERIASRARLPCTATLFYPVAILMLGYFSNLVTNGQDYVGAIKQLKENATLVLSPLAIIPIAAFAFFREIELHNYLDKLLNVKADVNKHIVAQMSRLASEAGYDHPDRVVGRKAMSWFYFYINQQPTTRAYAFELWEGYYVGLYISLSSALSFFMCLYLAAISRQEWVLFSSLAPFALFVLVWFVRHNSTVPKMKEIAEQQIGDITRDSQILVEAKQRFG